MAATVRTVSFFLTLCSCAHLSLTLTFKQLGVMNVKTPAFLGLLPNVTSSGVRKFDLLISTFSGIPFTQDYVWGVPDVGSRLQSVSSWTPEIITNQLHWPNEAEPVPVDVFGKAGVVSVSAGFFLPTKTDGGLFLVDGWPGKAGSPVDISSDDEKRDWFFHRVEWVDMDGDGRKDALTARAFFNPLAGSSKGELLWFQQPESNGSTTPYWSLHKIITGPDTFFRSANLTIGGKLRTVIITCGYFSKELRITWTEDPKGNWTNTKSINSAVIDDDLGQFFSVEVKIYRILLLFVCFFVFSATNGTVAVYEIPNDVTTQPFERLIIKSGYSVPGFFTNGKGAPGSAFPFYPSTNKTGKPYILVAGDDDRHAYVMTPLSQDPKDWRYKQDTVYHGGGTVGQIVMADVNGDGMQEVFVPAYNDNKVIVYQVTDTEG
ncbi:PREDICTED: uncharacterized protein LOC109473102 [Branchiostoma belcheri]|uniref:Uncharacterized protein LOC109473102 n=1 Tax=Branchiostoma belcheri TaxID=7741 RepID=A0A6P4YH16_BRABE|nr:PREDICTED: uncharacterized protein LOC109473102 [Branchiostoma belcheri]